MKDFVLWRHYLRMTVKIRVANHLAYWQNAIWRRGGNNHSKTLGGYFLKFRLYTLITFISYFKKYTLNSNVGTRGHKAIYGVEEALFLQAGMFCLLSAMKHFPR